MDQGSSAFLKSFVLFADLLKLSHLWNAYLTWKSLLLLSMCVVYVCLFTLVMPDSILTFWSFDFNQIIYCLPFYMEFPTN